jgi:ABC-2 type transport system permease protein
VTGTAGSAGFTAALHVELLKVRRSVAPLLTALAFAIAPLVGGLFMYILADPDRARRMGLIGQKAQIAGGGSDWPAYFAFLAQAATVGGFVLFAFVVAWVFGREFSDGTVRYLLALPTSRAAIIAAKLVVVALWCAALTALITALGLVVGAALGLPGWSGEALRQGLVHVWGGAGLTLVIVIPLALIAGVGRGYLAPLGFAMLVLILAQVVGATGRGAFFPWSIPALYAQVAGEAGGELTAISFAVVAVTGAAGAAGTFAWWLYADFPR